MLQLKVALAPLPAGFGVVGVMVVGVMVVGVVVVGIMVVGVVVVGVVGSHPVSLHRLRSTDGKELQLTGSPLNEKALLLMLVMLLEFSQIIFDIL